MASFRKKYPVDKKLHRADKFIPPPPGLRSPKKPRLNRVKPKVLKQHKTDLEQCPLASTSTANRPTLQPLFSIIVLGACIY